MESTRNRASAVTPLDKTRKIEHGANAWEGESMARFCLSIDIVAQELGEFISFTKYSLNRGMAIERFEVYDKAAPALTKTCLYIVLDEFPRCESVGMGTNLICTNNIALCPHIHDCPNKKCNVIVLKDLTGIQAFNKLCVMFERFLNRGRYLELLSLSDSTLTKFLDTGREVLGYPLCIMDTNKNVIAVSNYGGAFSNPLWSSVKSKDRRSCYDILSHTDVNLNEVSLTKEQVQEASIAGYYVLEQNLYRNGRVIATLWAFHTDFAERFNIASKQMFGWIAERAGEWARRTKQLKPGRGLPKEDFLLDVASGAVKTPGAIASAQQELIDDLADIDRCSSYHLVALKRPATERHFSQPLQILDEVEHAVPHSICAAINNALLVLIGVESGGQIPPSSVDTLANLCKTEGFHGVISAQYAKLSDTSKVLPQLTDCLAFADEDDLPCTIYRYHEFLVRQIISCVARVQPPVTMMHPAITALADYDGKNSTDYLKTLTFYLRNRCNVADTAKELNMHRNTLLHRIKRIGEIAEISFDDWRVRRALLYSIDMREALDALPASTEDAESEEEQIDYSMALCPME